MCGTQVFCDDDDGDDPQNNPRFGGADLWAVSSTFQQNHNNIRLVAA